MGICFNNEKGRKVRQSTFEEQKNSISKTKESIYNEVDINISICKSKNINEESNKNKDSSEKKNDSYNSIEISNIDDKEEEKKNSDKIGSNIKEEKLSNKKELNYEYKEKKDINTKNKKDINLNEINIKSSSNNNGKKENDEDNITNSFLGDNNIFINMSPGNINCDGKKDNEIITIEHNKNKYLKLIYLEIKHLNMNLMI